jgi:hypothetical protein
LFEEKTAVTLGDLAGKILDPSLTLVSPADTAFITSPSDALKGSPFELSIAEQYDSKALSQSRWSEISDYGAAEALMQRLDRDVVIPSPIKENTHSMTLSESKRNINDSIPTMDRRDLEISDGQRRRDPIECESSTSSVASVHSVPALTIPRDQIACIQSTKGCSEIELMQDLHMSDRESNSMGGKEEYEDTDESSEESSLELPRSSSIPELPVLVGFAAMASGGDSYASLDTCFSLPSIDFEDTEPTRSRRLQIPLGPTRQASMASTRSDHTNVEENEETESTQNPNVRHPYTLDLAMSQDSPVPSVPYLQYMLKMSDNTFGTSFVSQVTDPMHAEVAARHLRRIAQRTGLRHVAQVINWMVARTPDRAPPATWTTGAPIPVPTSAHASGLTLPPSWPVLPLAKLLTILTLDVTADISGLLVAYTTKTWPLNTIIKVSSLMVPTLQFTMLFGSFCGVLQFSL